MFALFVIACAGLASAVSAANHTIVVGGTAGLIYTPSNITAAVGDFVTFVFQNPNHTVTQSAFATPCSLLQNTTSATVGFDSGFVPVSANATEFPAWTIEVTAAAPIWFYCRQTGHCKKGMVGSINAALTGNKTFADFKNLAISSGGSTASSSTAAPFSTVSATGAGASGEGSATLSGAAAISAVSGAQQSVSSSSSASASSSSTSTGDAASLKANMVPVLTALAAICAVAVCFM